MRSTAALLLWLLVSAAAVAAGPERRRIARPKRELLPQEGPSDDQIWDTGLMEKTVTAAAIVERGLEYYRRTHIKRFNGPVLGYVTPWNRHGYDLAVRFRAKLTHVSPVWYQLKRAADRSWVLAGGHEVNATWVQAVREPVSEEADEGARSTTKIVPRIIVELSTGQDHVDLVTSSSTAAIQVILDEVKSRGWDGIVLETWKAWASINGPSNPQFMAAASGFIHALSAGLRGAPGGRRELILAVPPPVPSGYSRPFTAKEHLQALSPHVDFWSLMTYDYALGSGAQPNAPLPWLHSQASVLQDTSEGGPVLVSPSQALMGVNFYGYDYRMQSGVAEAVTASGILSLLAKHHSDLEWDQEQGEHSFKYRGVDGLHRVYYPTPRALEMRLELFAKWGFGVSIWELGQGLDRFFDLL